MTDFTQFKVPGGGGHEFHNLCPPSPVEANSFIQEAENVQMLTHAYVRKHIATGHRSDSGDPRIFFHLTEIVTIVHATTIDLQVNYDAEITGIVLPFAR